MSYVAACLVGCQWGLVVSKVFGVRGCCCQIVACEAKIFLLLSLNLFPRRFG